MKHTLVLIWASVASAARTGLRSPGKGAALSLASEAKINATQAAAIAQKVKAGVAEALLDQKVYAALKMQASCNIKAQAEVPSKRCKDLCESSGGCEKVCEEVRSMICSAQGGPQVLAIAGGPTESETAAAAAAAATNAVRDAVKGAIADVAKTAAEAAKQAQASVKLAVQQATDVSKKAAHEAAAAAAAAAAKSASKEAAENAHAVASTAAAAAISAAKAAIAPAKGAAGGAAAPAPGPAPAGF